MKYLRLTALLVVFLAACQFNPDDTYFADLEEPTEPELEIVELSLYSDTIFLTYYKDIQFNFSAGQHNVMQVDILVDDEQKYSSSNYNGTFTILANDISEGIHKLSFSVITNSNSGSIADQLGYEGFQFLSNEWTLVCVKNDRMANYAEKEIENGKLKLSWEAHNKPNFKGYRVLKKHNDYSAAYKEYFVTEPYFIDEAYVGETAHYDIYTEYYSSDSYLFQWASFDVENTLPQLKIRNTNDGAFEMYWENNEFSAAIKNYRLINLVTPADTVTLQESTPSEENSYAMPDAVFGDEIEYWLVVVPNNPENSFNNEAVYYHATRFDGKIGTSSFNYSQISAIKNEELLVLKDGYIYRYDAGTKTVVDSLSYNWDNCHVGYSGFSVSPQGQYFTSKESCNNNLVLMEPNKLQNYQSYAIDHILTEGMSFSSMPVSDNGIVVMKDYGQISVYDVLNNKLIDSYESSSATYSTGISSNGDYFFVKTHQLCFYKIEADTITTVWESEPNYNYQFNAFAYDSENTENIIVYDGEKLYHKRASDFSTQKSFSLNEEQIINFDILNRQVLAYTNGYLSVYSIDTGTQIYKVAINPDILYANYHCKLAYNTIYVGDGICINIPTN